MFSGEAFFQNRYTAQGDGMIAFASSVPAQSVQYALHQQGIVMQKSAFLACEGSRTFCFPETPGAGFFGGEGFIMQRLSGNGIAFLEIDGYAVEYDLAPGQQIIVDTGYLAACSETCTIDVTTVQGVKNVLFGGEGLFNTVVTGPGHVVLQSMPISQLSAALMIGNARN